MNQATETAEQLQPLEEGVRVCLFTDTLGDVNGVSRFIRTIAECARATGRELHVLTSTRFECPDAWNVHNLKPRYSRAMPGYATLDVVVPPASALMKLADRLKPHVVHVSTPGPVGAVGRRYARTRGLPMLATYHTDFPAYVERLFDDDALTYVCAAAMRRFYRPCARVFSRSEEYAAALVRLGVRRERIETLRPGIDTSAFNPRFKDESGRVWDGVKGARRDSLKVLYVGRVSVEKNLPLLTKVWGQVRKECVSRGIDAQLVVVGDGPYRARMEEALGEGGAVFAGFRFGEELSALYASSDVFVFPSTTDTLGQVVMEAQGAGLAVLVTDQGGPSEVVDDGETGLVLPGEGAAAEGAWVRALVGLLGDQERRARLGRAGAAKIAPMSIMHSFEHFWGVHEEVAERSPKEAES